MMCSFKKLTETLIFVGLIVFATIFIWRLTVPPKPVILYKATQQGTPVVTTANDSSSPDNHPHVHNPVDLSQSHVQAEMRNEDISGMSNETHIHRGFYPKMAAASQHFQEFFKEIDTNPEAARTELEAYTSLLFQNHPRIKDLNKLFFAIVDGKGGLVRDVISLMKLKKQMLIDTNPEGFAPNIKYVEQLLKELERIEKIYESEGRLETQKIPFVMEYGK